MKIKELGIDGKDVGNIEVSDNIFSLKPRKDIIKMVVDWQISRHSKKTGYTKTRGEVAGSSKKLDHKKDLEEHDMVILQLQFLLVAVLRMDQKQRESIELKD